jgi:hypothetical protein
VVSVLSNRGCSFFDYMKFWRHSADTSLVTDLEFSHPKLRAAVRLACRRIVQLNFGRRNDDTCLVSC